LLKIIVYAAPYKGLALLSVLFYVLDTIFNLLSLLLFIPFLDLLFTKDVAVAPAKPDFALTKEAASGYFDYYMGQFITSEEDKIGALVFICISVGVLFFLKNLFRYLAKFFMAQLRSGVVRDIRYKLFGKIVALPLSYYSEEKKGDILARITSDVSEIEWSIMNSLEMIFRDPLTIAMSFVILIVISPQLTLFSMILLPVSGLIIGQVGKSLKKTSAKLQDKNGQLLSMVEETISGLRIIKAFNAQKSVDEKFKTLNNDYRLTMSQMLYKRDMASPMSEFLSSLIMISLVWFGGSLVLANDSQMNGSEFLGYIIIFSQLIAPIKSVTTSYYNIQKGAASVDRIGHVLDAKNKITDMPNAKPISEFKNEIEYKDVTFGYNSEKVIKGVNFKVEKGKIMALVGPSGGGKSSMVDLLPRFYDNDDGEILIDGIANKEYKLKDLRGLMGIVTQESILFNDTVFNNIAFGMEASLEKVIEAAKVANAHEFIESLPKGYETNIGDRGGKLSGGQRQRLSIARAVLKNPPILILDEATSSLDTESEKLVQDALFKLMENRTTFVIAHRLSTIQHADEIIVIDEGMIAERGTHNELIQQEGIYKKLSDLQTFS
ncbi:MAG: ABC transporter ATP-binding protein, partial [Vicingaceae bacterium]